MTMTLMSFAAQPKRIYAYDLSVDFAANVYTFSFTANETPTAGEIVFYDVTSKEEVGKVTLENLVLGKNEVALAAYQLPGANGQQLNWAVKLSAAAVTAYEAVYADAAPAYRRGYSNVDVNPESDYFGAVYVADCTKTKSLSKFYTYSPSYVISNAEGYSLGASDWAFGRFTIAPDGKVWLSDYSDGHSGLFIVDPANLTTATQFFTGTRASSGLIKNGDVEVGSSLSCASLYGTGANTKLVTVAEDYTGTSFPVAVFNVGQNDGSIATSWDAAPNILFNTLGNAAQIFEAKACEKGIWVATNRGNGSNNSGATSLRFYTWDGTCTWASHEHLDIINGNLGGGIAITPDEKQIVMKIHDNTIAVFDITWNENTPTLTTHATFNSGYAAVSAINLDYAGNIVTIAGTNFGNTDDKRMSLVVYSNPTNDNTCEVPAKKASVVTKVEASATLYTVTTNVNDPAMGAVSGNVGTYEEGATAILTAEPNEGHSFVNWTVGEEILTDNPLSIVVNSDLVVTANFAVNKYNVTVVADPVRGEVSGAGEYAYNTTATLTATANDGYEFAGWSNGSKENPLTITVKEDTELTANFRAVLVSSITLNALPVQDYSASIVGTVKRAVQNGENTIVLTHEADGTPHIYNVAHATKTVTELSQEGVVARDPENAGDYLSISDIALTEDGKLIASNYMRCEQNATPATGYKAGEIRYYIWDNINAAPTRWFTTNKTANSSYADVSYTFAIKGTSTNAQLMSTAVHNNNRAARINLHTVVNGAETAYHRFGLHTTASEYTEAKQGLNFQLTATPLDNIWSLEGELTDPTSFEVPAVVGDEYNGTALTGINLGKKYNGASYIANYNEHHLMVAPYADEEGKLAGVKVLGITDGFAAATVVKTNTALETAIEATAAAATAVVDGEGNLTIYLIADAKVYTFTQKIAKYTVTVTAENGTVTGAGEYEENTEVTLVATANEGYEFVNWTKGEEMVSTAATYTFTITENVALVANFQEVVAATITWELNGGEVLAAVPTNAELWEAFMPYYQEYYDVVRAEQPIASVAVFLSAGMGDDATIFTSEDSDYKWLGDYIIKVTTEQNAALTTLANWKFNAQAFFNANQYTGWPKSADFTEAGKPENWGPAYQAAHEVVLPTEPVEEDYVLPTPVKEGYTFVGWYDNAEGTGEAYTVIPAGWAGTLYAIWKQGPTTALENIAVEGKAVKAIITGQLVIIKNGVQYNAQGQVVK